MRLQFARSDIRVIRHGVQVERRGAAGDGPANLPKSRQAERLACNLRTTRRAAPTGKYPRRRKATNDNTAV